jgi:predicted metal-dependent peptidase
MSGTLTANKKTRNDKMDNLIGPTDKNIDMQARDRLIGARVSLLLKNSFFGNLATRLKLINSDDWLSTAATDGRNFYYNSRFVMKLSRGEVEFLFGHEVLHVCYDHMGRRESRDPQIFNIANDYAVNADLKRHRVGEFIKSVPCLYEQKYDGKSSEEIYDDLIKNAKKMSLDDLIDQMLDEHMDGDQDGDGDGDGDSDADGDGNKKGKRGKRPAPLSDAEREELRQEIRQNMIAAAKTAENAGDVPLGVKRMIQEITEPKMPWRELIQTNLTSAIRVDYSFIRPSRRGWHMDAIMPGMTPGEEIDIAVAIDMSGSISAKQASMFLGEIRGIMEAFDSYRVHVFCFDTEVYNPQDFNSDNMDTIESYDPQGGGGTDFNAIFNHLKERGQDTKRLVVFTDGYPCGTWGDENYTDVTWIIHGNDSIKPPFGTWAYMND